MSSHLISLQWVDLVLNTYTVYSRWQVSFEDWFQESWMSHGEGEKGLICKASTNKRKYNKWINQWIEWILMCNNGKHTEKQTAVWFKKNYFLFADILSGFAWSDLIWFDLIFHLLRPIYIYFFQEFFSFFSFPFPTLMSKPCNLFFFKFLLNLEEEEEDWEDREEEETEEPEGFCLACPFLFLL